MKVLITGVAGFIGSHTALRLCAEGHEVVGIDNLNDYYSVDLKMARLERLAGHGNFRFLRLDITDKQALLELFAQQRFTQVIHLAAQAGVRYSLDNPDAYAQANLIGFLNLLEACRQSPPDHLVYASSSSVYGMNDKMPFSTTDAVDRPASLYAASKRANELMAYTYAHLYRIPATGLRFFTVYGPWGRPDMALFKFTQSILSGQPIEVYNNGQLSRDFTYIDDIVEGVVRLLVRPPVSQAASAAGGLAAVEAPCRVLNIGRGEPVKLLDFIECIESSLGLQAQKRYLPMQPGDIEKTWADVSELAQLIDFRPDTSLATGVARFVSWYRAFYRT